MKPARSSSFARFAMMQASRPENKSRYLKLGWRVMLVWGVGVALLGVLMSLLNHLVSPQILYYTSADAQFTGITWLQLQQLYPRLTLWLTLFFDSTAAQLLFYGILTAFVSATAYRRGERWAWFSLLSAFLIFFAHLIPSFFYLSSGILVNSGISIGVAGILVMVVFLLAGLVLPGTELFRKAAATPADPSKGSRRLSFGWIALVIFGAVNVFFAILVPLTDHLYYPTQPPPTYMAPDAMFTGASWQQVMSLSPALGLWIVLQMDNMCAGMMGGGILASAVSVKAFRFSRRWSWYALLSVNAVFWISPLLYSIPFYQAGIYMGGGVAVGLPPDPVSTMLLIWPGVSILALLLPIAHFSLRKSSGKVPPTIPPV
jgi:hypothetical protein